MWTRTSILACLLALPLAVHGQDKKINAGRLLGQTPETGSLPLSSKPSDDARQNLGKAARATERGVMLVGYNKAGHGTAWVISKKNRLLVTNAHVGDIFHENKGKMVAIPSGTSQIYTVEKVWYHPGVRRYSKNNAMFSVRSMDPKEGQVDPSSPDLAVLQLSAEGPDLTVEFPLATAEELTSLFAQPTAMMGFPGHDTSWPGLGDKAAATIHEGIISRVTDFEMNPGVPDAELQFLQYTMAGWGGFSGSPVFLPNGHVAGVHNMARVEKNKQSGEIRHIPHGVRVDCVVEVLVHHGLDDKVPFKIDKSKVAVERWIKPDARTEKARAEFAKAMALVNEASYLIFVKQDFIKGEEKCIEAIKLAPNYASAFNMRGCAINSFEYYNRSKLSNKARMELNIKGLEDFRKAVQLDPSNPDYVIGLCNAKTGLSYHTEEDSLNKEVLMIINDLLTTTSLSDMTRGNAICQRAGAYRRLGDNEAAWRDYNEAIRLWPDDPTMFESRAYFLKIKKLGDLGRADFAKAKELREQKIEWGMKITDAIDGGAAKNAGLSAGDIIVSVGAKKVRSLDELSAALAAAEGPVNAVVIKAESKKRETITITPKAGKIGVAVEPVELN
ncbi:MAG: trypsin-like peptidase domain-containing protein [Planctomycetes bacterium]|nr:trypsin-like peptidase domain-containing protein [Planctomycetota bacterium]